MRTCVPCSGAPLNGVASIAVTSLSGKRIPTCTATLRSPIFQSQNQKSNRAPPKRRKRLLMQHNERSVAEVVAATRHLGQGDFVTVSPVDEKAGAQAVAHLDSRILRSPLMAGGQPTKRFEFTVLAHEVVLLDVTRGPPRSFTGTGRSPLNLKSLIYEGKQKEVNHRQA